MNIRHLKIFVSVVKNNSITKASKELYLTQPAVSLAIKELEESYQTKLFSRINKKLYITDAGKKLYEYSAMILDLYKKMEDDMLHHNYEEYLRIGSSITIAKMILSPLLNNLKTNNPNVKIFTYVNNSESILKMLEENKIDIALVEGNFISDHLIFEQFSEDIFEFICSKKCILANTSVQISKLKNYPMIIREEGSSQKEIIRSIHNLYNINFDIFMETNSNDCLLNFVKDDFGISLLSKNLITSDVATFNVYDMDIKRNLFYAVHPNKFQSKLLKKCISYLNNL